MKKFENLTEQAVFQPKKTVSVDTITQSFNVIRIYLTDSIDEIDSHMEQIEAIRSASEVDIIEIYTISNCGGYVNTIVPLCNALANTPAHTVCYVEGHCASAGTFPAMVVDEVRVGAYASFMLHCASGGAGHGTMVNSAESARFFEKQYSSLLEDIYHGFISPEEAKMLHDGREIYLDSEEIEERLKLRAEKMKQEAECCECEDCQEDCLDLEPMHVLTEEAPVKKTPAKKAAPKKAAKKE